LAIRAAQIKKRNRLATVLIGSLFLVFVSLMTQACADLSSRVPRDKISLNEFCWGLDDRENKALGCSAQDFIIKASLCEIEVILEEEDFLGLSKEQKDSIRSKYRRFKRSYKLKQAKLNLESVQLNEILQAEDFDLDQARQEIQAVRSLCIRMTNKAVSTLIAIKSVLSPGQRKKVTQILIPASRKIEAQKRYPVIPCGE